MAHYFDAYQYLQHVFSRSRFILVTVVTALLLAIIVSNLQPRIYTATSRVLIEPPAGSDPRASMAVSPVYLELLRTYELFASSDDLFARAAKKFDLSRNGSIERLKRSVLKVEVPRNTKILEIKARLRDPRTAQAMALYIAEETVRLNRGTNVEGDQELTASLEKQLVEARSRVDNANLAWRQMSLREPVEGLRVQIESATALRSRLQQEVLAAQLNITDGEDREKALAHEVKEGRGGGSLEVTREQLRSDRLRTEGLRAQIRGLDREIESTREMLAGRSSRQEELAAERKSAQAALEATENHLREARAFFGFRGERLRVIDPGVVPDTPSSPNIPLNVSAALLMSLVLGILLVSVEFSLRLYKAESLRHELRTGRAND